MTPSHRHDLGPSPWILRFAPLVPAGALVLDVAAGTGRHARYFAQAKARVLAVDRDAALLAGLAGLANVSTRVMDLEAGTSSVGDSGLFGDTRFDAIVVTNYLHRPLLPALRDALAPHGVLLYETFMIGNERYGRPANPAFLLQRGELLDAFGRELQVLAFEQGEVTRGTERAVVQRIAAVGPAHAWPTTLLPTTLLPAAPSSEGGPD